MKCISFSLPSLLFLYASLSFAATERVTITFSNKTKADITLIFVTARDVGMAGARAQADIPSGKNVNVPVTFDSNLINGKIDPDTFGAKIKSGAIQEDALYRIQIIYNPEKHGYSVDLKKIYDALGKCSSKTLDVEFTGFPGNVNSAPPFTVSCGIGEFEEIRIKARPTVSKKTYQILRLPENATEWQILGVKPDTRTEWVNKMYREKRSFFPNDPEVLLLFMIQLFF